MIRNRFHCAFIHRLGLRLSEARPWGNNPVLGLLAAARTGARLDAAGIDSLFGLASGKIGLDVHGALTREVLAPFELIRIGKAHDYELGVSLVFQCLCHVVQHCLAGVVDPPGPSFVRIAAVAEFAGLRRWRRRSLDRHLGVGGGG